MARTGRRPGTSGSRETIAAAARKQFAERGFDRTTIRGVAADAGVDPALVMHFFGSKDGLFAACIEWPFDPDEEVARLLDGDRAQLGERLTRLFVATWDAEEGRNPIVALLQTAMAQEAAERLLRDFVARRLLGPLAAGLGTPDAELRVALAAAQLVGVGIARYVLRIEPLASIPADAVVARVAPAVQHHLTEFVPGPAD